MTERTSDRLEHLSARELVRLDPGRELDAMLEPPQEQIRRLDLTTLAIGDEAARAKSTKRSERIRIANAGLTATPDELEGLNEELRFANAANAELQVALWIL